jgi:RHS repeat-associated protein
LNTTFAYDPTNKLTARSLPNGVATNYQYDGLNRLTRLTHAKDANTLADFQYQFNAVGNITQMTDGAGAHNYSYDPLDRLTAATHPDQTNESYTFDDVGNRTASHQGSSYSYQAFNHLVAANGTSFGYDANGNLSSKTEASGSWAYSWDYENRLKQAIKAAGVTVNYAYDALGRRVQQTSSAGAATKFVYDGANVIRDLDASGGTIADYLNGLGIDNKLRHSIGGAPSYFVPDHLGTTRALSDASGNLAGSFGYESFGNLTSGSASTRYSFTGREADSETGLLYYRARWYDPQQGRFISQDPLGFIRRDQNLYVYVRNNPLRYVDPEGTNPLLVAALVVGGEALLHYYLTTRSDRFYPGDNGRKAHCYVNCMSTRIHGFNPFWPTAASVEQEVVGLAHGLVAGDFRYTLNDSIGDLAADFHGQAVAPIVWRWCKDLCAECPF